MGVKIQLSKSTYGITGRTNVTLELGPIDPYLRFWCVVCLCGHDQQFNPCLHIYPNLSTFLCLGSIELSVLTIQTSVIWKAKVKTLRSLVITVCATDGMSIRYTVTRLYGGTKRIATVRNNQQWTLPFDLIHCRCPVYCFTLFIENVSHTIIDYFVISTAYRLVSCRQKELNNRWKI